MWSGTPGYDVHQSDYRTHESPNVFRLSWGMKLIFICIDIQRSKHLIQSYILGLLRHAQALSKVHTRYFQNEEFALYISRINEDIT